VNVVTSGFCTEIRYCAFLKVHILFVIRDVALSKFM